MPNVRMRTTLALKTGWRRIVRRTYRTSWPRLTSHGISQTARLSSTQRTGLPNSRKAVRRASSLDMPRVDEIVDALGDVGLDLPCELAIGSRPADDLSHHGVMTAPASSP